MTSSGYYPSALDRSEKERLVRYLLERKDDLLRTRLQRFVPNPGLEGALGFQERFIRSTAKIRLITSGNQGGKTTVGAWDHACLAMGCHPYRKLPVPNVGLIVTAKPHAEGIEKDIVPALVGLVGSEDIVEIKNNMRGSPFKIVWKSGSVSYLMSAEQDNQVFEGTPYGHAWFDEPFRREIFVAVGRGLLKADGPLSWTCTPLEEPWIYEEIYCPAIEGSDPDIAVFEGSTDENRRISEEAKQKFFKHLTPDEVAARRYGKFAHLMGRVFKTYEPKVHRIPPFPIPAHWPVWVAIDPHRQKPHAVVLVAIAPNQTAYICAELYSVCTIRDLAHQLQALEQDYHVVQRVIDTSAQEEGWGRVSARSMLNDLGVRTKLAQKKNLKASGLTLINQRFQDGSLFVFDTCARMHRELTLQVYKRSRDKTSVQEEPEKKFDDMTDALRYILIERPEFSGCARIHEIGPIYQPGTAESDEWTDNPHRWWIG